MKKITQITLLMFLLLGMGTSKVHAQYVTIPNTTFKNWVLAHVPHPTSTTNITPAEAAAYTGTITIGGSNLTDLTGIQAFTHITLLNVSANALTSLNVSGCTALNTLSCTYNSLTSLTVTGCPALNAIYCSDNALTSLNVSSNPMLEYLYCYNNSITSLNLSSNPILGYFECYNNALTSLNVQNGHNDLISIFDASSNPSLTCIKVDNVANANSNANWIKDPEASYSTNCALDATTFDNQSIVESYPNPFTSAFTIKVNFDQLDAIQITVYDSIGRTIENRTVLNAANTIFEMGNDYPTGIYCINVKQGSKNQILRIIKH
jgi:hypothetical protein